MKTIKISLEIIDTETNTVKKLDVFVDHTLATQCHIPSDRYLVKSFESLINTFRLAHPGEL